MKPRVIGHPIISNEVAIIPIFRGQTSFLITLDAADVPLVQSCRAVYTSITPQGKTYISVTTADGERTMLHRFLLGLKPGDLDADHINGQPLDNRRINLRIVPDTTNLLNRSARGGRLGIRGVTLSRGHYLAKIGGVYLGYFADLRDAAEAVWLCLLAVDPIAADRYLRELPESLERAA